MRESTLGTFSHAVIEIACRYCARRGRYRREALIQKHGSGLTLDRFVRMVSSDCGYAEVRTGSSGCNGPYVVPPETRSPSVARECMLVKTKKPI